MRPFASSVIALSVATLPTPASAAVLTFFAPFAPEAVGATGSGSVTVSIDTVTSMMGISASWAGLSGTTTVAHIHCCTATPMTGTVGVAVTPGTLPGFPVGVTAGSYAVSLDLTQNATYTAAFRNNFGVGTAAGAQAALLQGLQQQRAYFNIHSNRFPGGEIRGFPQAVPEPASWALLIFGFGAIGGALRRRSGVAALAA